MNEDENLTDKPTAVPEEESKSASEQLLIPDVLPSTLQTESKQAASRLSEHATHPGQPPTMLAEVAGGQIGPYKLLQQIGEGGMGAVFMAEQQQPVRRVVALKVIKSGMDSARVIARFEQERQALALMDHPNIAKVLDADKTETGQPYFVMELVKGIPITKYCEEQRLTIRQRLDLFVPVCQAIQHAHQKGILHRDIKPSNVLVTVYDGKAAPKVIDFGVAKAIGQKLTEQTLETGFGSFVGTLMYMSPEQAALHSVDIDTRSDVYSLGVLLYELLTGTTPLTWQRLKEVSLLESIRLIREEEPPRPSTRLSASSDSLASLSAQRHTEPSALVKAVRGEVDWIVMKALEKDRKRRYETANALARDIERYLADEAVEAGPPSATYRLRKMAWRYRRSLATAAALLLLVVAGGVVSTILAVWALRAEKAAVSERNRALEAEAEAKEQRDKALTAEQSAKRSEEDATAVLAFFQDNVLSAGRPKGQEGGLGGKVTLRKAVDEAEPKIGQAFAQRPLVEASIRETLGTTYLDLGDYPQAIRQKERALALREDKLGTDHPYTLNSRINLATAYDSAGRIGDAIRLYEQALKQCEEKLATDHHLTLAARNGLAAAYWSAGRIAEVVLLFEQTLKQCEAKLGADHPHTLSTRCNLANAYQSAGRTADAIPLFEQTLEQREAKLGTDHPDTLSIRGSLALAYRAAGRTADAIRMNEQTVQQREAKLGADHPDTLLSQNNLATAYYAAGRTADAIRLLEPTLKLQEAKLGPDHPNTLLSRRNLAAAYHSAGRTTDAIRLLEQNLKREEAKLGADHPDTLASRGNLAAIYIGAGRANEAIRLNEQILKQREVKLGADHPDTLNSRNNLGHAYQAAGRIADAISEFERTLKQREAKLGADHPDTFKSRNYLANAYEQAGEFAKAEPLYRTMLNQMRQRFGTEDARTAAQMALLGLTLLHEHKYADAESMLRDCLKVRQAKQPDAWTTFNTQSTLGEALLGQKKYSDAEPLLLKGYQGMKERQAKIPPQGKARLREALERLVQLYEATGNKDEAAKWRDQLQAAKRIK